MADDIAQRIERFRFPRGAVVTEHRNRGYTLHHAPSGAPVARLRPTGRDDSVEVLYWSVRKERWTAVGPFGKCGKSSSIYPFVCPCQGEGEVKSFAALDLGNDAVAPELAYVTARYAALAPFGKVATAERTTEPAGTSGTSDKELAFSPAIRERHLPDSPSDRLNHARTKNSRFDNRSAI